VAPLRDAVADKQPAPELVYCFSDRWFVPQVTLEGVTDGISAPILWHLERVPINALSIDTGDKVKPRGPRDKGPVEALVCDHGPSIGDLKLPLAFVVSHRSVCGVGVGFVSWHRFLFLLVNVAKLR